MIWPVWFSLYWFSYECPVLILALPVFSPLLNNVRMPHFCASKLKQGNSRLISLYYGTMGLSSTDAAKWYKMDCPPEAKVNKFC